MFLYGNSKEFAVKDFIVSAAGALPQSVLDGLLGRLVARFLEEDDVVFGLNLSNFIERL